MIILTERLQTIADCINQGEKVADVGTDHGYLPLYLFEKGITENPIMTDVSPGSLNKAKENALRMFPNRNFDFRLGDGLDVIEKGEVDTVVMAGIGGNLTVEILDWDISKVFSFKKLILQPRNNGGNLRRYLYRYGFELKELFIVTEEKRLCEIMVALVPEEYKGQRNTEDISQVIFDYPDKLVESRSENARRYLLNEFEKNNNIIEKIKEGMGNTAGSGDEKIEEIKTQINRIKELLDKYED